jgi:hypothetical protein
MIDPIDIAMVVCDRPRLTETSICEIKARTEMPHQLIVLDNGSQRQTTAVLANLYYEGAIDILIRSPQNKGIHWAHNTLLDHVMSKPYYVSTDNDLIPSYPTADGCWLTRLVALADEWTGYAALACRPHVMIGDSPSIWNGAPEVLIRHWVGAHLRLMFTESVRVTGWNRQKFDPKRNNEERFICGQLTAMGHKVGYARDIRCIHLFGDPDRGEDPWGYTVSMTPQDHGHNEVWPPVHHYQWDKMGVNWMTCEAAND